MDAGSAHGRLRPDMPLGAAQEVRHETRWTL